MTGSSRRRRRVPLLSRASRALLLALLASLPVPAALAQFAAAAPGAPVMATSVELDGTPDALLAYARTHHPELAAMRFDADAARARAGSADALPDPMVQIELNDVSRAGGRGIDLLPGRVGNTEYTVRQGLPWPGKRALMKDVAQAQANEAVERSTARWQEIARSIRQTVAQWVLVNESARFARENLDLLAQLEQIAQTRYGNGVAAQQDVIRAQSERSTLLAEAARLHGQGLLLEARLRALIGADEGMRIRPPQALRVDKPLPEAAAFALRAQRVEQVRARNPALAADAARIAAAEKSRDLTYKNRYPDMTVGIKPMQVGERVESWTLMFETTIPLQQEKRRSDERAAERALDAARARQSATLNEALAALDEAQAQEHTAQQVDALVSTRLLPQAEVSLQAALGAYETGRVDFATVLDAQRQVRAAKEEGVRSRAEQVIWRAEIARLTGEMP